MQIEFKNRAAPVLQIIGLCVLASIIYGIAHDLITAHVCVEYFTVHHPKIIESTSPLAMALLWGILATWWMGVFFGGMIAIAARVGRLQKIGWREIIRPLALTLSCAWFLAMMFGLGLYLVARYGAGTSGVGSEYDRRLLVVGTIHALSYLLTAIGGIGLVGWTIWKRSSLFKLNQANRFARSENEA